jgi:hypothetical protein
VTALVSFSRTRIEHNIPISRDRMAFRNPRQAPLPPIQVEEEGRDALWVYGLEMTGKAEIYYQAHQRPLTYLKTGYPILRLDSTVDKPNRRQEFKYLYVQLSRIYGNETRARRDLLPLPPLTAHSWHANEKKWKSLCAHHIRINGPSTLRYSLGSPRSGTGTRDTGVRLWIETRAPLEPGPEGWSSCRSERSRALD